jgi:serine protease
MKKFFVYSLLLIILQAVTAQNITIDTDVRFVITFEISVDFPGADFIENLIEGTLTNSSNRFQKIMNIPAIQAIVVKITQSAAKLLLPLPFIKSIELDRLYTAETGSPRQASFDDEMIPYGIDLVGARSVSNANVGDIKICIIDSGYDVNHPDLPAVSGTTLDSSYPWDEDGTGHGTHIAGTIAAIGGNGEGVVGVLGDGNSNLHIVRVFDSNGSMYSSNLLEAIQTCIDAGSKIVSMSLVQFGGPSIFERDFLQEKYDEGILFIAAAGNEATSAYGYPASYGSVISVASIDESKWRSDFSNFNDRVSLTAPGSEIYSTQAGGGYVYLGGTSMATPHVTGVAALVWSLFPDKTNSEIWTALISSAEDLGNEGYDIDYGYGLVRADLAVSWLEGDGGSNSPPTPSPSSEDNNPTSGNGSCQNSPSDWVDSDGDGCDDFYYTSSRCSSFGNRFEDSVYGKTANDVCCTCGGGSDSSSQCEDDTDWEDSEGDGCDWYNTLSRCAVHGDSFENDGKTASDACCLCQGVTVSSIQAFSKDRSNSTTNGSQPQTNNTIGTSNANIFANKFTVICAIGIFLTFVII